MSSTEIVTAVIGVLGLFGIGWRILDSFQSKKEQEKRRTEDEKLRLERVGIVDTALKRLIDTTDSINAEIKRINGTVASHQQWIEEHKRTTEPAMDAFRTIQLDVARLKDQVKDLQDSFIRTYDLNRAKT